MEAATAVAEILQIEVVFATTERQELVAVELPTGATIADAIRESGIQDRFDESLDEFDVGVWGRAANRDQAVGDGDRVEIYRPLARDPMDARRELAKAQRFGSSS